MSLITIPGMDDSGLVNTSTAPSGGGLRPFPCSAHGWTQHTAHVVKACIKSFGGETSQRRDNISITVANCQFGGEILIDIDPRNVPPGCSDVPKAQADNLKTLMMAIKLLGAHTQGKLDTAKLEKASGQLVTIIAKHKGFREHEGRSYHKVSLILKGEATEEVDVDESVGLPPLPGAIGQAAMPQGQQQSFDDIPF